MVPILTLLITIIVVGFVICYFFRHPIKSLKAIFYSVIVFTVGAAVVGLGLWALLAQVG